MKKFSCHFLCAFIGMSIFTSPCSWANRQDPLPVYDQGLVSIQAENLPLAAILERLAAAAGVEIYLTDKLPDRSADASFEKRPLMDVLDSLLRGYSYAVIYSEGADGRQRVFIDMEKTQGLPGSTMELAADVREISAAAERLDQGSVSSPSEPGVRDDGAAPRSGSGLYELDGTGWQSVLEHAASSEPSSFVSSESKTSGYSSASGYTVSTAAGSTSSGASGSTGADGSGSGTQANSQQSSDSGSAVAPEYENMSDSEKQIAQLEYQIASLEKQIESGEADQFYQHWASIKDPKYIYNHRADLAYKQQRLEELQGNE